MIRWKGLLVSLLMVLLFASPALAFRVTLAWDANTEPDLDHYDVYYSYVSGEYDSDRSFEASIDEYGGFEVPVDFTEGTMVFFVVTATDWQDQESGTSNEVYTDGTGDPDGPPASPTGCYIVTVTP